jgi:hypothetical protein
LLESVKSILFGQKLTKYDGGHMTVGAVENHQYSAVTKLAKFAMTDRVVFERTKPVRESMGAKLYRGLFNETLMVLHIAANWIPFIQTRYESEFGSISITREERNALAVLILHSWRTAIYEIADDIKAGIRNERGRLFN